MAGKLQVNGCKIDDVDDLFEPTGGVAVGFEVHLHPRGPALIRKGSHELVLAQRFASGNGDAVQTRTAKSYQSVPWLS